MRTAFRDLAFSADCDSPCEILDEFTFVEMARRARDCGFASHLCFPLVEVDIDQRQY
jgi:hypothetical protein